MIKKIKYVLFFSLLLILGFCTKSEAKIISTDPTVESGGTVTITINSQEGVASGAIEVTDAGGLTFISASATGGQANGSKVAFAGTENKNSNIATYKFKVPTVENTKTYKVVFTSKDMADALGNNVPSTTATSTVTVKAKEEEKPTTPSTSDDSGKKEETTPTVQAPTFTSVNETVYATGNVNVRSSYSSSSEKIGSLNTGDAVKRTGKGSNGWSKIEFNGKTAYVFSDYLSTTKPEKSNNKALNSLTVTPGTLTPEFDPETTEYEMTIESDVSEIKVDAVAADEKAKIEVTGNTELKLGENTITIKVTAEDETVRNYIITVIKQEKELPGLASLTIKGVELNTTFQKDIYNYEITVENDVKILEIDAVTAIEGNLVEIIGNENLEDGSIIKILVYSGEKGAEDTVVTEYQITVKKNLTTTMVEEEGKVTLLSQNHLLYIATIVLVTISLISLFVARYFTTKDSKEEKTEIPNLKEELYNFDEKPEEKEEVTISEKRGKSKGKHSM